MLTRDTLFRDRKEKMTPREAAVYEIMQGVNHFINSALDGNREMATGDCLEMQYSDFLSRLNEAFENTVETRSRCVSCAAGGSGFEIAVFDDFFRIAEYAYGAIKATVQNPNREIKKEEVRLPVARSAGFGTKTMRWLSTRQGRTVAEKISPDNKVLTTKTVFSVDTKENRELMYLYKNLHEIVSSRLSNTRCADCGLQDGCGREWIAHMRKLLATYSRIKTDELGEVKCEKQAYQNNKLMCDLNYKIIWDAVKMLSRVEDDIQKQFARVRTRFATLLYWLLIGGILKDGRVKIYDRVGRVTDVDGELAFSGDGGSGDGGRAECDTVVVCDGRSYFKYKLNFYLEGTVIRIENPDFPESGEKIDVADYFDLLENFFATDEAEAPPDFYTYLSSKREEFIGAHFVSSGEEEGAEEVAQNAAQLNRGSRLIFDLASGFYGGTEFSGAYQAATYNYYPDGKGGGKLFMRRGAGFSYRKNPAPVLGVVNDLDGNARASIVGKSVEDVFRETGAAARKKSLCLIPDTLGDFNDGIKRQLKSFGERVTPVPRSVAAAYAYAKKHGRNCTLTCYDFDLPVPDMTVIDIAKNADGEFEFTRIQRKILSERECSLDSVLWEYVRTYAATNGFTAPETAAETLVKTRDALYPVRNEKNILIETENSYATIGYDGDILKKVSAPVFAFADERAKELQKNNAVCFLFNTGVAHKNFLTFDELKEGCAEIAKRVDEGATIWKEYLPELSLEVAKGGRFAELKLIEKGDVRDVSDRSMDERIDIALSGVDRKFTFPKGVDKIRLPLKREEFGATKRDKMAIFGGSAFPLSKDTEVELKLSYSFGDPDSYRLTAVGAEDKNFVVTSVWSDGDEGEVICPGYDKNTQIGVTESELNSLTGFFEGLENKLYSLVSGKADKNGRYASPLGSSEQRTQANYESNLFDAIYDNQGKRVYFKRNLLKKFTETANGGDCNAILESFFMSDSFKYMYEYLIADPKNSDLTRLANGNRTEKFLRSKLNNSILGFLSNLGAFYRLGGNAKSRKIIKSLIDSFGTETRSESLISASRCVSDDLSVMEKAAAKITQAFDGGYEDERKAQDNKIRVIRNISAVCWYNSEWIYNFYKADMTLVKRIEKFVTGYLIGEGADKVALKATEVRDIMEVALALCRLRIFDKSIFDPAADGTNELIAALKRIDEAVYENRIEKFVSRVKFNKQDKKDDGLYRVSDPCYLLIAQLTGSRRLNLIGFEEN